VFVKEAWKEVGVCSKRCYVADRWPVD